MTLNFSRAKYLWEVLAGALIAQQHVSYMHTGANDDGIDLLSMCGIIEADDWASEYTIDLRFDLAYDPLLLSKEASYVETLAQCSNISFPTTMPLLNSLGLGRDDGYLVLAYGAMHPESIIPMTVLRALLRLMKTYCSKVYYIGNERPDIALMESEILCAVPLKEKIDVLTGARLIVGTPNEWTWLATAWRKKIAVLYPDTQSMKRWYPFAHNSFGRVLFSRSNLDSARLITDVRTLIAML